MRLVVACVWLFALVGIAATCASCMPQIAGGDNGHEERITTYDPAVRKFGEAVMKGDWPTAYAMTTPAFQATTSQVQLQAEYDKLIADIVKDDPTFKPNTVQVEQGGLPSSEAEAKDTYDFKTMPPKSQWKAWMFAEIGEAVQGTMERGLEARVLVIEEQCQPKFAHVEFGYQD
ncbi:MAG: hypothetical protein QOJ65_435 [Fimbriimonadaceae bacterium]|jgi:hypothetical protein|nr:hypothetical protein [Fimbriimonadaceae bacterium]